MGSRVKQLLLDAQGLHCLPVSSFNIRSGLGCHTGRLCQVPLGEHLLAWPHLKGIQFAVQRLSQYELKSKKDKYYVTSKLLS